MAAYWRPTGEIRVRAFNSSAVLLRSSRRVFYCLSSSICANHICASCYWSIGTRNWWREHGRLCLQAGRKSVCVVDDITPYYAKPGASWPSLNSYVTTAWLPFRAPRKKEIFFSPLSLLPWKPYHRDTGWTRHGGAGPAWNVDVLLTLVGDPFSFLHTSCRYVLLPEVGMNLSVVHEIVQKLTTVWQGWTSWIKLYIYYPDILYFLYNLL